MSGIQRSKCSNITINELADVFRPFVTDHDLPDVKYSEQMTAPLDASAMMKAKPLLCAIKQKVPSLLLAGKTTEGALKSLGVTDATSKSKMLKCMLYKINQTRPGVPWVQNLFQASQSIIIDYAKASEEAQPKVEKVKDEPKVVPDEDEPQEQQYFYGWCGGLKKKRGGSRSIREKKKRIFSGH